MIQRHSSSRSEWLPHFTNVIFPDLYTYISSSSLLGEFSVIPFTLVFFVRVEYPLFHSDNVVERTDGDRPWFTFGLPKWPRRKCRNLIRNSRLNFSCNVKTIRPFKWIYRNHIEYYFQLYIVIAIFEQYNIICCIIFILGIMFLIYEKKIYRFYIKIENVNNDIKWWKYKI